MTKQPEVDIVNFLDTQVAELTKGTNLFFGSISEGKRFPTNATFVQSSGGPIPIRSMGRTGELRTALCTITVRNLNRSAGRALSDSILEALSGLDGIISGYEDVDMQTSTALDSGRNEKGAIIFNQVVRLRWNANTI